MSLLLTNVSHITAVFKYYVFHCFLLSVLCFALFVWCNVRVLCHWCQSSFHPVMDRKTVVQKFMENSSFWPKTKGIFLSLTQWFIWAKKKVLGVIGTLRLEYKFKILGLSFQAVSAFIEGVVSKETVVLRRWGSSIQKFGFINGVDIVNWPPYRDSKS